MAQTPQFTFQPAQRQQKRLRLAFEGPAGSGKTATALRVARALFPEGRIAVIDSEGGSASAYAVSGDEPEAPERLRFRFDQLVLQSYAPDTYTAAIGAAEQAGYDVCIIDSLSHAWAGKEGAMEQVDRAAQRSRSENRFTAWADVTPMQNRLVDAILQSGMHIIATMRSKTEYVLVERNGKQVPQKVGMAPVQRDNIDYEFDIVGVLDDQHRLAITKTRYDALNGAEFDYPGEDLAAVLRSWISDGAPPPPSPKQLMAEVQREFEALGFGETADKPQRARAGHALMRILGRRPDEPAIISWLRENGDDAHLLALAVAGELDTLAEPERVPAETEE